MDALLDLNPGQFYLILAPRRAARPMMTAVIAQLALAGPLQVLDGGNIFDAYGVARGCRRRTGDLEAALQRIHLARAFTCYQMERLLERQPASETPLVVLDLLSSFSDENVPLPERLRLLERCREHLRRLSSSTPVQAGAARSAGGALAISISHPAPGAAAGWLERVEAEAAQVLRLDLPGPADLPGFQPRLF